MKKSFLKSLVLAIVGMLGIGSLIATASNEKEIRKASAGYVQYDILRNSTVYSVGDSKTSGKWKWDFYAYHHEDTQDSSWIEYTQNELNNFRATYDAAGATQRITYITFDARYQSTDGSYIVVKVERNGITKDVGTIDGNTVGACGTTIGAYGDSIFIRAKVYKNNGASESGNGKLYFKNIQLYYSDSHTVKFNANGHGTAPSSQTVEDGGKVSKPSDLSATGYTFGGWYKEAACTNAWNFNSNTVTSDITLYAKWTANKYTVTLDRQGATTGSTSVTATYASAMPSITVPSRTGYTFGGYFTETNGSGTQYYSNTGSSSRNYDKTTALTLYAKWTANKYTINFNKQSGTGGTNSVQATYDQAMPSIQLPTRTGYDFNGYYSGTAGTGTKYYNANGSSAQNCNFTSAITMYAYWTIKPEIQAVIDAIDQIGTVEYPDSRAKIELAEAKYADLNDAYKPVVSNYNDLLNARDTFNDYRDAAIQDCKDKIDAIGYVVYPYSRNAIEAAEAAYALLDADDLDEISNAQLLFDDRKAYNEQRDYAINKVNEAINNLGEISYPNSEKAIKDAEQLYDRLADDDKNTTLIPNYKDLTDARNKFNSDRDDAVQDTIDAINNIAKPFDAEAQEDIDTARSLFDALGPNERNLQTIPNFPRLVDAETAIVVADQIKATKSITDPASYEQACNDAKEAYNNLTSSQKLFIPDDVFDMLDDNDEALAVIEQINNIGKIGYDDESKAAIDAAREAYENLSDEQKALINNIDTLKQAEEDYAKVKDVVEKINAIGQIQFTAESKALLDAANQAYEALTDAQKAMLPKDSLKTLVSDTKIYDAMAKIDAIGEVDYTVESILKVEAARGAVDLLTTGERSLVTNYGKLTKAENDLNAVDNVVRKVAEIGLLSYNTESSSKLEAAKNAYNNLTNDQKDMVPETILLLLNGYENAWDVLEVIHQIGNIANTDACRDSLAAALEAYNSLTDLEKNMINDKEYEALQDMAKAMAVIEKINAIGDVEYTSEDKELINSARNAYNALSESQKALVVNYDDLLVAEGMYAHVDAFVRQVNSIGAIGYDKQSKAKIDAAFDALYDLTGNELIMTPDEIIDHLMDLQRAYEVMRLIDESKKVEYTPNYQEDLQSARSAYNALTDAQKALVANYGLLEAAEADYSAIDAVVKLIENIKEVSYDTQTASKISAARNAYNALTDAQKARFPVEYLNKLINSEKAYAALEKINSIGNLDASGACKTKIEQARREYAELPSEAKALIKAGQIKPLEDAEAAIKVIAKIHAIGTLKYDVNSKVLMEAARNAYDALTDDQKLLVSNYLTLTKDETDYAAVDSVVKLINELGSPRYGQEYKDKLTAARNAYNALTQDQKNIFPADLLARLVDYETVYEALEKIHAVESGNEQDIQDARDAYEALSDEQKGMLDGSDYDDLLNAEYQHKVHKSDSSIMSIVYWTIGITAAVTVVACLIVFLLSRKKKDDDEEEKQAA